MNFNHESIPASYQLTDTFTKASSKPSFSNIRNKFGVQDHSQLRLKRSNKKTNKSDIVSYILGLFQLDRILLVLVIASNLG